MQRWCNTCHLRQAPPDLIVIVVVVIDIAGLVTIADLVTIGGNQLGKAAAKHCTDRRDAVSYDRLANDIDGEGIVA